MATSSERAVLTGSRAEVTLMAYDGPSTLHSQHSEIARVLGAHGVAHLYHFTPIGDLPGIMKQGAVLCTRRLKDLGLFDAVETGGNARSLALDAERGNDQLWH